MNGLVICETVAAITTHLRIVTTAHPICLGGHASPKPRTLCDLDVGWDTQLPVRHEDGVLTARCGHCRAAATERGL